MPMVNDNNTALKVRLDKWIWAARLTKTRALARDLIQAGKVHYNGQKSKPGKIVELGALIRVPAGWDVKEVEVTGIEEKRQPAKLAEMMYQETADSVAKREQNQLARKMQTFQTLDLVNRSDEGWGLTLEPWWAPNAARERVDPAARTLDTGDTILPDQPRSEAEVISELANALAWRGETDTSAADLRLDLGRQPTVDELIEAIPALDKWAAPIAAHWPSETGEDTLPGYDPAAVSGFSSTSEKTGTTLPPHDPGCATATIGVETDHEQQPIA